MSALDVFVRVNKRNSPWTAHLDALRTCRACPDMKSHPVFGPVEGAKVMLIGQAPGPREEDAGRPFAWTAGKKLFTWFDSIGLNEETFRRHVHIAAVARCFPGRAPSGGDRVPDPVEISACAKHLDRELVLLKPDLLIAVGALAAAQFLPAAPLDRLVGSQHRVTRAGQTFDLVVLPHPSGRSTWIHRPGNKELLELSLRRIARHPALRDRRTRRRSSVKKPD